jgi:hypothetical protein
MKLSFNINDIPELKELFLAEPSILHTNYPHIAKNIVLFWGSVDFDEYFTSLMISDRNKDRAGFADEVSLEIFNIKSIHDSTFPSIAMNKMWRGDTL